MGGFDPAILALVGLLITVAAITAATALIASLRQRRHEAASLTAIDFVRSSFVSRLAHGEPIDELLSQVVEALRDSLRLDTAEVWLSEGGELNLTVSEPARKATPIPLPPNLDSIAANAPVSGRPWAKVWLPELLPDRDDTAMRLAPISLSGELLGLVVICREGSEERLGAEADVMLEEFVREAGAALKKLRLDAALHESVEQLRRQARDLQESRARIVAAADAERRRIERDLHDGAQQYLVAIAVKADVVKRLADRDPTRSREMLDELVGDTQRALDELRNLSHGIYPPLLSSGGLCEALAAACRRTVLPADLEATGIGRYPPEVEAAVYFCCVEALQNAAKYAGDGAAAHVAVWEEGDDLSFEVRDDGRGFDPAGATPGAGLTNMGDRLGAVGGRLTVESEPGSGTRVRGAVPLTDSSWPDGPSTGSQAR
jgi:signal transduction histidine kinase